MTFDLSWVDPIILVVLCITVAVNIWLARKDRLSRTKIDTARLFLDSVDHFKYNDMLEALNLLHKDPKKDIEPVTAERIIAYYDFLLTLMYGETIDKEYVKTFFVYDIKLIKDNESIMHVLNESKKHLNGSRYLNIIKYLKTQT